METISTILLFFYLFFMLLAAGYGILSYVLTSRGIQTIADRRGIKHAWMAWLPVVNGWVLGSISDQYQQVTRFKHKRKRVALLILQIAGYALTIIMVISLILVELQAGSLSNGMNSESMIGSLAVFLLSYFGALGVGIACTVIYYIALYDLYASCKPNSAVLYLVLTLVVSVTTPFLVFSCRKKDMGMGAIRPRVRSNW